MAFRGKLSDRGILTTAEGLSDVQFRGPAPLDHGTGHSPGDMDLIDAIDLP